eukprot:2557112-Karenia_brevis.AAC.1
MKKIVWAKVYAIWLHILARAIFWKVVFVLSQPPAELPEKPVDKDMRPYGVHPCRLDFLEIHITYS